MPEGGIQPLLLSAAFWVAVAGYRGRTPLRFVAGLTLGALLAHMGWALLRADVIAARPLLLLDLRAGYCVLFVPCGMLLAAPWRGAEREASLFLSQALPTLPLALGVARLGCLLAGCCGGVGMDRDWLPRHPVALYEVAGLALLHLVLRRAPQAVVAPVFCVGFGGLRLLLEPLRAGPPPGDPLLPAALVAGLWVALGPLLSLRSLRVRLSRGLDPGSRDAFHVPRAPTITHGRSMMRAYRRFAGTRTGRALSAVQCVLLLLATSCIPNGYEGRGDGQPAAGRPDFQRPMLVELSGSTTVNLVGGNFMLDRVDLTIETRLGTQSYGAVYNSTGNRWSWSFDLRYDGERFIDSTGASYNVLGLAYGAKIPGSDWVRVGPDTLRRIDGMLFHFEDGIVSTVQRASSDYPMLFYRHTTVRGERRFDRIYDCTVSRCDEVVSLHWADLPASGVQLQVITDRTGREARFRYRDGQIVSARDALDLEQLWPGFRYEYAGEGGRLSAVVDSEDERMELAYANGRLAELRGIGAQNPVHHFEYGWDAQRQLWYGAVLGPDGQLCFRRYEGRGLLRELSCAPDEFLAMTWDEELRPTSRNHNGVATSWSYPDPNSVVETRPSGNLVTTVYSPTGVDRTGGRPVSSVRDSLGTVEIRGYNPAGRLRAVINGEGDRIWFQYDSDQNVTALIRNSTVDEDEVSLPTYLSEHDLSGQPGRISHPNGISESRSYDGVGNQVRGSNLAGDGDPGRPGVVSRRFDGDRNLRELRVRGIESSGAVGPEEVIRIDYRSDHQVARISRPYGGDSRFEYDELGRQVARHDTVDGFERATHMTYDASGNPRSMEQPNGMRVELDYDALDRVTEQRWLRDGVTSKILRIARTNGRVAELRDSTYAYQPETMQYDPAGRVTRIDYPVGLATRQLEYDVRDRETSTRYIQDGLNVRNIEYEYDLADRRVLVRDNGDRAWWKIYRAGRVTQQFYGSSNYSFVEHQLTGQTTGRVGRTRVYNYLGHEVARADQYRNRCTASFENLCADVFDSVWGEQGGRYHESYAIGPVARWTHGPAAGRRVLAALVDDSGAGLALQAGDPDLGQHFDYDALNNIERIATLPDGPETAFVYNAERNRLLETRDAISADIVHSYQYDEAGYVTSRDGVPISYDDAGLTVSIGNDIQFEWDALGRPVSSVVEGRERYYYFGGDVLGDASANLLAIESDEFLIDLSQNTHLYRHYDFRKNVKFVTNDQGEVVQYFAYGPYGVVEELGGGQGQSFARGERIGGTGLTMLGVRVLDSDVGRFLAPDPILQLGDGYSYAAGNPIDLWDADGRHVTPVAGVGLVLGTATVAMAAAAVMISVITSWGTVGGLAQVALAFIGLSALGVYIFMLILMVVIVSALYQSEGVMGGVSSAGFGGAAVSGVSGAGGAAGASVGGGVVPEFGGGCSPTELARVPDAGRLLFLLLPLEMLVASLLLLRRRRWSQARRSR